MYLLFERVIIIIYLMYQMVDFLLLLSKTSLDTRHGSFERTITIHEYDTLRLQKSSDILTL
jgi:hypothetical protein